MTLLESIILVLIAFCLISACGLMIWAFVLYSKKKWVKNKEGFYVSQRISSEAEERFRHLLLRIFKNHQEEFRSCELLKQVSLPRIVGIAEDKFTWGEFNKIGNKSIDFVLVDRGSGKAKLVIELDDKTHELEHRKQRDNFVDNVLTNAKIPILHIKVQGYYKEDEIYDSIITKLNP